jgi:hypothetical protein
MTKVLLQVIAFPLLVFLFIVGILAFLLNIATFIRPEQPIDRLQHYHVMLRMIAWIYAPSVFVMFLVAHSIGAVMDLPPLHKMNQWQITLLGGLCIGLALYVVLGTPLSVRLSNGAWEVGGRGGWRPVRVEEAACHLWLNMRYSLAIIMFMSFIGCVTLWKFVTVLHNYSTLEKRL